LGLTGSDRSFWTSIPFVVIIVAFILAIILLPLVEIEICDVDGNCSQTKILASVFEIFTRP